MILKRNGKEFNSGYLPNYQQYAQPSIVHSISATQNQYHPQNNQQSQFMPAQNFKHNSLAKHKHQLSVSKRFLFNMSQQNSTTCLTKRSSLEICYCRCHSTRQKSEDYTNKAVKTQLKSLLSEVRSLRQFKKEITEEYELLCMNFSFILQLSSKNICSFVADNISKLKQKMKVPHQFVKLDQKIYKLKQQQFIELKQKFKPLYTQNSRLKGQIQQLTAKLRKSQENLISIIQDKDHTNSFYATATPRSSNRNKNIFSPQKQLWNSSKKSIRENYGSNRVTSRQRFLNNNKMDNIHSRINIIEQKMMNDIQLINDPLK